MVRRYSITMPHISSYYGLSCISYVPFIGPMRLTLKISCARPAHKKIKIDISTCFSLILFLKTIKQYKKRSDEKHPEYSPLNHEVCMQIQLGKMDFCSVLWRLPSPLYFKQCSQCIFYLCAASFFGEKFDICILYIPSLLASYRHMHVKYAFLCFGVSILSSFMLGKYFRAFAKLHIGQGIRTTADQGFSLQNS